jgi:hypothetical protein
LLSRLKRGQGRGKKKNFEKYIKKELPIWSRKMIPMA